MRKTATLLILICVCSVLTAQSYSEFINRSFDCIAKQNWSCAEESLLAALRAEPANPQNALILSNLGTIQRRIGKNADAIKSYTNALMITPRSVTLLKNRASLYAIMDSTDMAIRDYSSAIALDSKEEGALYDRGMIYLEKKDTASARYDFEHLLKINPKSSNARIGLATLMKYRNYYKEAIDLYTQVITLNKDMASLYFGRAEAYFYMGKILLAKEDVKKAIELNNSDPLAYILYAKIKWAQYEKDDAIRDLDKAVLLGASKERVDVIKEELRRHK
ncbi:MAG: hypothetical protein RR293_02185 [Bacteroidales bacterium]